jgi:hypothetical protein
MRSLVILAITIAALSLCNAQLPSSGQFLYTPFTLDTCATPTTGETTTKYLPSNPCFKFGTTKSALVTAYNSTTYVAAVSNYDNIFCNATITSNTTLTCDGSCKPTGTTFYRCSYIQVPSGNYTFTGFTNSSCSVPTNNNNTYNIAKSHCWSTTSTNSFFPVSYNSTTSALTSSYFSSSGCSNFAVATPKTLTCNGSCQLDPNNASYYTCAYSSGAKLVASLTMIFALLLIFL